VANTKTVSLSTSLTDIGIKVDANTYEIVLAFFTGMTTSQKTAKAFTENLYRISQQTEIDVLTLLESFEGTDKMSMTMTMAYYLNSFSNKTVMYGVNNIIQANQPVARNIVQ
jgi:hypothetical protein